MYSYYITIIVLNVLIFSVWVWILCVYFKNRKSWHRYGCFLNALSYVLLFISNIDIWSGQPHNVSLTGVLFRYACYITQLASGICFLYNYYHTKINNENLE